MGRLIVFKVAGIGVLSRDRRVLRGRPRSQDMSFPDDPAPIASTLGPGATARRD